MLAPDSTVVKNQITNTFGANATVTGWVEGLQNCVLPNLSPQPAWFASLSTALQNAQGNVMNWFSLSSSIATDGTQSYIDYATLFEAITQVLSPLLAKIEAQGNIPTSTQQQELVQLIGQLLSHAQSALSTLTNLQNSIQGFHGQMVHDHNIFVEGINNALQTEGQDAAKVQAVQNSIQAIMLELGIYNSKIDSSNFSFETTVFKTILTLTFTLETLGIGGIISMALSLGSAITSSVINTEAFEREINNLITLMAQLEQADIQLALAQTTVENLKSVLSSNDDALQTMIDLTSVWTTIVDDLQWLSIVLAQPKINISTIPAFASLTAANQNWQSISNFSTLVQYYSITQGAPVMLAKSIPSASKTRQSKKQPHACVSPSMA